MSRRTFYTDSVSVVKQTSDNWRKRNSAGYKFGLDYSIDNKSSLLLSWMQNYGQGTSHEFSENTLTTGEGLLTKFYTINSDEDDNNTSNAVLITEGVNSPAGTTLDRFLIRMKRRRMKM